MSLTLFVDLGDVTEPSLKTIKLPVTGQLQAVVSREHTEPDLDPHTFPFSGSLPSTNTNTSPPRVNGMSGNWGGEQSVSAGLAADQLAPQGLAAARGRPGSLTAGWLVLLLALC